MFKPSIMNTTEEAVPPYVVALLLNMFKNNANEGEHIQNVVIKTLPPGTICVLDSSSFLNNEGIFAEVNSPSIQTTTNSDLMIGTTNILHTNADSISSTIGESHLDKDMSNDEGESANNKSSVFVCIFCKEEFSQVSAYKKHLMWHRNFKRFKCEKCSAGFNVESNLTLHMAIHNKEEYKCPSCSITFQRVASLKSHLLLHQVDEIYSCNECTAEFEQEEDLLKHKQNHSTDYLDNKSPGLVCSYCKIKCRDSNTYREHIALHIKVKKVMLKGKKPRKTHGHREYRHICKTCGKSFPKLSLLGRHERIHSGEKPFVCHLCKRGFNQKCTLQIHLSKHSGVKPFECTLCPAKFNQRGNLRVHVEKAHMVFVPEEKKYRCSQCTCIFKRLGSLNGHITKMHSNNHSEIDMVMKQLKELGEQTDSFVKGKNADMNLVPLATEKDSELVTATRLNISTSETCSSKSNYSYVTLTESGADGNLHKYLVKHRKTGDACHYICDFCSKDFKKPSDLIRHIRVHTKEKPFKCEHCGSAFSLKSTLISHLNTHKTPKCHKCQICSRQFSSTRTLNSHLRNHRKIVQGKQIEYYKCKICYKTFKTLEAATNHSNEHVNGGIRIDPEDFVMQQPLIQTEHGSLQPVAMPKNKLPYIDSKTEKNVRPHRCQICSAAFKRIMHLRRHMMVHTGEKKYKCDACSKMFYTGSSLREHMKFHVGIKNHGCKLCGKKFITLSLLRRHISIHATDKPYICPYCNKRFKSVVLCRKHMNIHKKNVAFQVCTVRENLEPNVTESVPSKRTNISSSPSDGGSLTIMKLGSSQKSSNVVSQDLISKDITFRCPKVSEISKTKASLTELNPLEAQKSLLGSDEIHLADNINLYMTYPQVKLQNSDSLLLTSLNNMQDSNILLNIDSLNSDLDTHNVEIFNENQIFTPQVIYNPNDLTDFCKDPKSVNISLELQNRKESSHCNAINTVPSTTVCENVPIVNQDETGINITVNIDPTQNNILDESGLNLECSDSQNANKDVDNSSTSYLCTTCLEIFPSMSFFQNHDCITKEKDQTHERQNGESSSTKTVSENVNTSNEKLLPDATKVENKAKHLCSYCVKGFRKPSDLSRHLRTHTGERPFACTLCDKKFTLKSTLESHYRVHNPSNKKHKCEVCNAFFTTKSTLKIHLYKHTGKTPHQCDFCPMKFRTPAHKKSHESTRHNSANPNKAAPKSKIMDILLSSLSNDGTPNQKNILLQNFTQSIQASMIADQPIVMEYNEIC